MNFLEQTLNEKLAQNLYEYRNNFYNFMIAKNLEIILSIISYKYDNEKVVLDSVEIEKHLRYYGSAVIGECIDGKYRLLGYVKQENKQVNLQEKYQEKSITFTIPNNVRLLTKDYRRLTEFSDGNYIVIYNHLIFNNYSTDYNILEHYIFKLSETELSRLSIVQQAKFNTVFRSENAQDEDMLKIMQDFYNGSPFIQTSIMFDPEENILNIGNHEIVNALKELKNEYNNTLNEMNAHFGINSSGIVKESGVSDSEVNSNNDYLSINLLTYLDSRNKELKLLERKGVKILAVANAKSEKVINPIDKFRNTSEVDVE